MDWGVCDFHSQALNAGQSFSLEDDSETIVIDGLPPRLITFRIFENLAEPVITFRVGHDGIPSDEWTFQASREFASALIKASLDERAPLRHELDRTKGVSDESEPGP